MLFGNKKKARELKVSIPNYAKSKKARKKSSVKTMSLWDVVMDAGMDV